MGMDYWPIMGYGLAIRQSEFAGLFDEEKLPINPFEKGFAECLDTIVGPSSYLYWDFTGEMWEDEIFYIYLPAGMPWEHPPGEMEPDDVRQEILSVLRPYLKEGVEAEILNRIDEVCDVGCG